MNTETPDIEAAAVKDVHKHALLFDLYVGGKWVGSRRTVEQCEDELTQICGIKINATYGSAW